MSLRLRLNLLLALLNLGFLAALGALLVSNERDSIREEITAGHRITVQLLGMVARTSPLVGPPPLVMYDFLQRLGRVRANDIRLYDAANVLRYRSPAATYKAGREAPQWFARLLAPRLAVTDIALPGARLEVEPEPSRAILDAWDDLLVLGGGLLALAVALQIILQWFIARLLQPADSLLGGLQRLARGDFAVRLPPPAVAEWRDMNEGFNRVAAALGAREAEQRELAAATLALADQRVTTRLIQDGIEAERKRVARELHDELGQSVTAIRLVAASIAQRQDSPAEAVQAAGHITQIAAGLYDGVQRIVRELRPAVLDDADLAAALDDLAREWRRHHPAPELTLTRHGDCADLGEATSLTAFRLVQEALTNAVRHSRPQRIAIDVRRDDAGLTLAVRNDGPPLAASAGSGQGLAGMKERVAALGGTLRAGPLADGYEVVAMLPLEAA